MKLTEEERSIIQNYLETDIDDLLATIGRIISVYDPDFETHMAAAQERGNAIKKAQEFLKSKKNDLRKKLCLELNIVEKMEQNQFSSNIELVTLIADAIAGQAVMLPPFTLSVILIKKGIYKLCDENE